MPLKWTLKCASYEQLSAMWMLKLYGIFLNGNREASLLESDLLNKGALKTDLTVCVILLNGH
jgi:hypothetical protein